MAITVTRATVAIVGTPGSPATTTSSPATLSHSAMSMTGGGVIEASVVVNVTIPSTPGGSSPTVQFEFSNDGTNYAPDGPPINVPVIAGTYGYRYDPPDACQSVDVVIVNNLTAGETFSAWAQGSTLAVS